MKRFLSRFCLTLLTVSQGWSAILTGPITNPANGHRYYLLSPQNWESAEAEAKMLGGHLATVNDAAENGWIFSTFSAFGGVNRTLMIGLNDAAVEGTFVWASGEASTYRNWNAGEPNNYAPTLNQDYAAIRPPNATPAGVWNDIALSESESFNGVVEVLPVDETIFPTIRTAVELAWPTLTTWQYQLQWSLSLEPGAQWNNLGEQFAGTGSTYYFLASVRDGEERFYRVVVTGTVNAPTTLSTVTIHTTQSALGIATYTATLTGDSSGTFKITGQSTGSGTFTYTPSGTTARLILTYTGDYLGDQERMTLIFTTGPGTTQSNQFSGTQDVSQTKNHPIAGTFAYQIP